MAKQSSFIKIEGTLEGLTFFKSQDGFLVRNKGGVAKGRIENDPAYVRTRENNSEFGHVATVGKRIRMAASSMISNAKDSRLTSKLHKVLSEIKNLDSTSVRGKRQVSLGMATAEGKLLLTGFNLNSRAVLSSILRQAYELTPADGEITIADFVPQQMLLSPSNSTHVSLSTAFTRVDLDTGEYETSFSNVVNLPLNMTAGTVVLTPASVPSLVGTSLHFLLIEFFQETNGVQYPLNSGAFNPLSLVGVF